ncbi:hypothetical protein LXA43DRAFT_1020059 [Ganoderma leucocontextum]|nr:hypothetical protein LXA43DRAFT_1020059 [Ganoderma leucocontextum]
MPGRYFWLPFHMIVSKLYVNALLATLNVRMSLTGQHGFTEVELNHTSIVFNSPGKVVTFPASTTMSEGPSGTLDGAASAKKGHAIDTCHEDIVSAA